MGQSLPLIHQQISASLRCERCHLRLVVRFLYAAKMDNGKTIGISRIFMDLRESNQLDYGTLVAEGREASTDLSYVYVWEPCQLMIGKMGQ